MINTKNKTISNGSKKAFTLIELLVVIMIIGLLAILIVLSLDGVREKSRDAKRIHDLKVVQKAMEMYKIDHNDLATKNLDDLNKYIEGNEFPQDPILSQTYFVCASGNEYLLLANLENTNINTGLTTILSGVNSTNCVLTGPNTSNIEYPNSLSCGNNILCFGTVSAFISGTP